jgi:hypothetical protein
MKLKAASLALLLLLSLGLAVPVLADEPGAAGVTAERVALMLDRLHAPALSGTIKTSGSCATSCGPGPEGSCTKSCKGSQSCSASCAGGKAICSCD